MICNIEEYAVHVGISGFRNADFAKAEEFLKSSRIEQHQIQFFDAQQVARPQHIYFAALNALQAFQNKTNLSKSLAVETMLYASAQRQIQKAIQKCGIKPDTKDMAVLAIGKGQLEVEGLLKKVASCLGTEPDLSVLELTKPKAKKIMETFQITEQELETVIKGDDWDGALVNLVVERMALLATQL
jgi:tRNA threonylcarbamoyladenosine modification (KEOPS) complex Cgi121 subunit